MAFSGKRYLALALTGSVILGAGTYILLNNYFERINIAVAARDIEKNSKIEEKDIRMLPYYKQALPEGYVSKKSEIVGVLIKVERKKGDPLTTNFFSSEDITKSMFEGLAEGEVLMAINLNYQEPLMDELKVGNNISVVSTEKEKDSNYSFISSQVTSGIYGNSINTSTGTEPEITSDDTLDETFGSSSNEVSDSSSNKTTGTAQNDTLESISVETSGGAIDDNEIVAIDKIVSNKSDKNTEVTTDESAGSTGKSIIDLNSYSLAENILVIDGQIIIKNLKIVNIMKTDSENNGLIGTKGKSNWCIFIKCGIKEAPVLSRITKEDKYKIFLEKVTFE
jgi:hypothetical protein